MVTTATPPPPSPPATITGPWNAEVVTDGKRQRKRPLPMTEVLQRIFSRTGNWPRRIGKSLFARDPAGNLAWVDRTAALFGWLGSECGVVRWAGGEGFVTQGQLYCELQRTAEEYMAVETIPHEPPAAGHYYTCATPEPGDGQTLERLLDFFCLETDLDRELLRAALATPLWGGPAGMRPAFLIVGREGRGTGKTKLAQMIAELYGGALDFSHNEDIAVIKQRLLSPDGLTARVALLDNIKTPRFSWGELEALVTAKTISGKRMYVGEAGRPNMLTWLLTLNGASLSTDMAQRVTEIHVSKPPRRPAWEEQVRGYIERHREKLFADLVGMLRGPQQPVSKHSRWATWEAEVLGRTHDPDACIALIEERRGDADVEVEEGELVEGHFASELVAMGYDIDREVVFVPSPIAAEWFNAATGSRGKTTAAGRALHQLHGEGRLRRLEPTRRGPQGSRGFLWVAKNAQPDSDTLDDIRQRIEGTWEGRRR